MSPSMQPPAVRLGEPLVLQAYPKMVCWHKFTPDGRLLVVTGFGGVKLYRTDDWAQVADLEGHAQAVSSGALSPDGRILATASTDTTVRLWSLPSGAPIDTLKLHKKTVAAVEFSPDGRLLATGSYDARATLYDLEAASTRATLKGHQGNVVSLAFAPDGNHLATGGLGAEVMVWETATGAAATPVLRLGGHNAVCAPLAWRADSLLTTDYTATLRAWDAVSGALRATTQLETPTVSGSSFSPDGRVLAATAPHMVSFFGTDTWELLETLSLPIKGVYGATWSPDGAHLAVSGADGKVRIYPVATD